MSILLLRVPNLVVKMSVRFAIFSALLCTVILSPSSDICCSCAIRVLFNRSSDPLSSLRVSLSINGNGSDRGNNVSMV